MTEPTDSEIALMAERSRLMRRLDQQDEERRRRRRPPTADGASAEPTKPKPLAPSQAEPV